MQAAGYVEPTPIQLRAHPGDPRRQGLDRFRANRDGQDRGVCAADSHTAESHGRMRVCLVLEPTRELAAQVETAFRDFARFTNLRMTAVVFGGVGYGQQRQDSARGVDILVATPGRLLDLLRQGRCICATWTVLVLDEADRMLDMGFLPDVRSIIDRCPKPADPAVLRHDPARDRAARRVGVAASRTHRDRREPFARRDRHACMYPVRRARNTSCSRRCCSGRTSTAFSSFVAPNTAPTGSPIG